MMTIEREEHYGATYYRLHFTLRGVGPAFRSWYDWAYDIGWNLRHLPETVGDVLWGLADGWRKR